jgi:putative nucleotidyltransferase with HDIG domain
MKKLPPKMRIYILGMYLVTAVTILLFYLQGYYILENMPNYKIIIFFSVLAILINNISEIYKNMVFNPSFALTTCILILYGPLLASITIIVGQTSRIAKGKNSYKHVLNTPFYGTLFNYCSSILSLYMATFCFIGLGGEYNINNILTNVTPIIIFCIIEFIINNIIMSIMSSVTTNKGIVYCFINNFRIIALIIFAMAPFGIVLALLFEKYTYIGVLLVLIPIAFTRYTFHLYVGAENHNIETVDTLMRAIENRDKYTEGHSQRVADLAVKIARKLKYSEWKIEELRTASMLHDVGKIGVRDHILNKPGKLTDEEYDIIKSHPEKGYEMLKDINSFQKILPIIRYHHERYDGKGYPEGKCAEELGIEIFIVQLADSIDAMSTDRPYRDALKKEEIKEEVKKFSGTQFHPKVVEAYLSIMESEKT